MRSLKGSCAQVCPAPALPPPLQWPRMWLMWPGSPPRQRGQQSGLDWTAPFCCSGCWVDRVNVWDVSIGHSAERNSVSRHTRFGLQLHGSSSASKLLFFSSLAHCMLTELTANRANSASRRASAHSAGSEPPSAVNPDARVLSKICLNFDRKMSFSRPHWTEVGPTVKR